MSNSVSSFFFEQLDIRGRFVRLDTQWQAWQQNRHTTASATELLGHCSAFLALIATDMKHAGKLTMQLRSKGEIKTLVVQCDVDQEGLKMRGMIDAPELQQTDALSQAFAGGDLAVTLFNTHTQTSYQSIVPIEHNTTKEIFAGYLTQSVQNPTNLWLYADKQQISGLYLEKMPDTDLKDADGWDRLNHLANTLSAEEMRDCDLNIIMQRLFHEETIIFNHETDALYHCPDEREKLTEVIRSLGQAECERILSEEGKLIMTNEICNRTYVFEQSDVEAIFGEPTKH